MDLSIIQNPKLRVAVQMGLNHISLAPTDIRQAMHVATEAFTWFYDRLRLQDYAMNFNEASELFRQLCSDKLHEASATNRFGLKHSGLALFSLPAVNNELKWLLSHMYVSGIDKANNNPCFMCIRHIRLQAFNRLSSDDFTSCRDEKY